MRLNPVVPLVLTTLATCAPVPSPPPETRAKDLTIGLVLALDGKKCVVRFADTGLKDAANAIAYTDHNVIWQVLSNACGEKTKAVAKALGLKYLKVKKTGNPATWSGRCTTLDIIPARIHTPLSFWCAIPSSLTGQGDETYEYEIDGDSVEPVDPGLDVRRNG
jgi:hypothetical protein